jgi:hypothetical protein
VISDVIGHSVALNFYNQKADRLLEDFRTLNNAVEGSGVFTEMVQSPCNTDTHFHGGRVD